MKPAIQPSILILALTGAGIGGVIAGRSDMPLPSWFSGATTGEKSMKIKDLIQMLNTNVERIDRRTFSRNLWGAGAAGAISAFAVALLTLGVRPDFASPDALGFLFVKLAFGLGGAGIAVLFLMKLAHPGGEQRARPLLLVIPYVDQHILSAREKLGAVTKAHAIAIALRERIIRQFMRNSKNCDRLFQPMVISGSLGSQSCSTRFFRAERRRS